MAKIYYLNEKVKQMNEQASTPQITLDTINELATTQLTVNIIAKAFLNMEPMSPKKLQKMCYYAYSWYLTLRNERLFESNFQAWIHGPVDPILYSEYREFGWRDIPQQETLPIEIQERPEIFEFLEEVYASYGHLNGDELEFLTHSQDPWLEAREGLDPYVSSRNPINDATIVRYHLAELNNGNS